MYSSLETSILWNIDRYTAGFIVSQKVGGDSIGLSGKIFHYEEKNKVGLKNN